MKVKGHALVWHNQLPSWVSSLTSATEVRAAMVAHIKAVVQHYKGKVQAWDVVNEAVSLDGKGMRDSVFYKYLGETFIDEAFQAARDTDPDAKLYYNDYNCEGLTLKANKVFDLVKGMKARNVPFDGVGLQMHYGEPNEATPTADFVANLKRYADLGLDLLISEMDVHVCGGLTSTQQQTVYHDLIAACVAQPRCIAATFWGISDKYSWLNDEPDLGCSNGQKPLGLLWDDNFKKKPAYTGVMDALLGR
jgi:endo-1,4-beta-xylanase